MIPFAVHWDKSAEMELARIWLYAPDPKAETVASARIDEILALDPVSYGRALSEGLCKLAVPPLTVYYSIHQVNHSVTVSDVFYRP
jgi:hypothetical protein